MKLSNYYCHKILEAKLLTMIVELEKDEKEDLKALAKFIVRLGREFPSSPSILLTVSDIHTLCNSFILFLVK